jgi:DNA repair protein RadA/Sms
VRVQYVCQSCGYRAPRWLGRCPSCEAWNSMVEEVEVPRKPAPRAANPVPLPEVSPLPEQRWPTGLAELDRVLGGGFVPGSLVLVGGDPGIGKSTLALQAAHRLAEAGRTVLYVAGEESPQQTRMRAERVGALSRGVWVVSETDLDAVLATARKLRPALLVVDSIQTVYRPDVPSAPGSVGQVRSVPRPSCSWRSPKAWRCCWWAT